MSMNLLEAETLLNGGAATPTSLSPAVSLGSLLDPKDADLLKPSTEEVDQLLSVLENTVTQTSFSKTGDDSFVKEMLNSELQIESAAQLPVGPTSTKSMPVPTNTTTTLDAANMFSSPLGGMSLSGSLGAIEPIEINEMSTSDPNLLFHLDVQQFSDNSKKLDQFIAKGGLTSCPAPGVQETTFVEETSVQQQQQFLLQDNPYGFPTAANPACSLEETNNIGEKRRRVPRRGSMPTMFKYSTSSDLDPFEPTPLAPSFNPASAVTTPTTTRPATSVPVYPETAQYNSTPQPQHYFRQPQAFMAQAQAQPAPQMMEEDLEERPAKAAAIEESVQPIGGGGGRRQRRRSSLPAISLNYTIPGQDPEITIIPKTTDVPQLSMTSSASPGTESSFYATTKSFVSSSSTTATNTPTASTEESTLAQENDAFVSATSGQQQQQHYENPFAPRPEGGGRRRIARRGSTGSFYVASTSGVGLEGDLLGKIQEEGAHKIISTSTTNNNNGDTADGAKMPDSLDPVATMKRLKELMAKSAETQQSLQQWDKRNGLPKSHSQTMVNSSRSRRQLQDGVILPKWDGTPLINNETELGKPKPRTKKNQDSDDENDCSDDNGLGGAMVDGPIHIDEHMMGGKMRRRMSAPVTSSFLF